MNTRIPSFIVFLVTAPWFPGASLGQWPGISFVEPSVVESLDAVVLRDIEGREEVDLRRLEYTQVHMGVQARIVLYAPDTAAAEAAARAAFDRIAELDAVMSDYRRDSELMRLVRAPASTPVPLSADLYTVLAFSQQLARRSGGAFDVTVGPIVQLWREARRAGRLPDADALAAALERSGYDLLELDARRRTAVLKVEGMALDLGGVAKGFAADEALAVLRAHGVPRALIEFGGDLTAGDAPPDQAGWRVVVEPGRRTFNLVNQALSTSGDAEQFVEIGGRRYSHVVDPRTGIGLTTRIAVTVIADRALRSDALATTLSVLGSDDGSTLAFGIDGVRVFFDTATQPR